MGENSHKLCGIATLHDIGSRTRGQGGCLPPQNFTPGALPPQKIVVLSIHIRTLSMHIRTHLRRLHMKIRKSTPLSSILLNEQANQTSVATYNQGRNRHQMTIYIYFTTGTTDYVLATRLSLTPHMHSYIKITCPHKMNLLPPRMHEFFSVNSCVCMD